MRPRLSRRSVRIGSVLLGGLGLTLLYLDANLVILGPKGMGQLTLSGTPIKVLWIGIGAVLLSIGSTLYAARLPK